MPSSSNGKSTLCSLFIFSNYLRMNDCGGMIYTFNTAECCKNMWPDAQNPALFSLSFKHISVMRG